MPFVFLGGVRWIFSMTGPVSKKKKKKKYKQNFIERTKCVTTKKILSLGGGGGKRFYSNTTFLLFTFDYPYTCSGLSYISFSSSSSSRLFLYFSQLCEFEWSGVKHDFHHLYSTIKLSIFRPPVGLFIIQRTKSPKQLKSA